MQRLSLIKEAISNPITQETLQMLRLVRDNSIATIWFNNPTAYNAVSNRMSDQFMFLLHHLDNDDSIKVIVLRSDHKKVFCAGGNIKDFQARLNNKNTKVGTYRALNLARCFRSLRKVLAAVVQGLALGGGCQIALLSDIILCSQKASFALPEINLGLIPALGGTQILPRLVGTKVAARLVLTGERISGIQAHRLNIATLIPEQNFAVKVEQYLNILASKPLDSLQAGKKAVRIALQTTLDQGLQHQTSISQALFNKKGPKQGISAFVQKRKPNFKNL